MRERPARLRVLVAEACQHDRLTAQCDDIGTHQIPRALAALFPHSRVEIVHAFGRADPEGAFDLALHCGGCYVSPQQLQARVRALRANRVPVVGYGTFLAYAAGGLAEARRVLDVWE